MMPERLLMAHPGCKGLWLAGRVARDALPRVRRCMSTERERRLEGDRSKWGAGPNGRSALQLVGTRSHKHIPNI